MQVQGAKVLVTGAGGFIGSHLVEALVVGGACVRAFVHYNARSSQGNLELVPADVRAQVEVVFGDVTDPLSVKTAVQGCEIVFHLAALIGIPYSYVAPQSYLGVNAIGTLNVLQASRDCGVGRVVHTSTSETYGSALYTPIDEQHPLQAQSPYAATKIAADKLAESYYRSFGLPVTTVRPFNTYGPRQSARAVIPSIVVQLLSAEGPLALGALQPVRDLTFVKDTVAGFLAIGLSDACVGRVVNVGSGRGISIGDLARLLMEVTGVDRDLVTDPARLRPENSEVVTLICANRCAKELGGWEPRCSLRAGLSETVAFVREHLAIYRADRFNY